MLEMSRRTRKEKASLRTYYYISGTYKGHRVRESLGTDSREEAKRLFEARRKEIVKLLDAGHSKSLTIADAVTMYLEGADERDGRFLDVLVAACGEELASEMDTGRAHAIAREVYPTASNATKNRQVIGPLSAVINWVSEHKKLCAPVRLKRLKEKKSAKTAVDWAWVENFQAAARDMGEARLGAMELFMFSTGARLEDAESLTGGDVCFDTKVATLRYTKNGDDRPALLTQDMVRELRAIGAVPGERVFGNWARRQLYKRWKAICERADVRYVPPHQAGRHSFATEMIVRNKVDPATTARLGGWKSTKLLMDTYAHPENERQVADAVFNRGGGTSLRVVGERNGSDTADGTKKIRALK